MTHAGMKRAFSEWFLLGFASATTGCLLFWMVSATSTRADFMIYFDQGQELSVADGKITVKQTPVTLVDSDFLKDFDFLKKSVPSAKFLSWNAPGVAIRKIDFGGGRPRWFVQFSLLLPTLACAVLAAVSIWPCLRAWREWRAELEPTARADS